MLVRFNGRIFKRTGFCCRCGFCCRVDFVCYSDYRDWDTVHQRLYGRMCPPVCAMMKRASDGRPTCMNYKGRNFGCRTFPWNPMQLTNIEFEDLPRIPVFKSGRYLTSRIVSEGTDADGNEIRRHVINEKDVTADDGIIVGYKPFSTVCTYKFEDVTEVIQRELPHLKIKRAKSPMVEMTRPDWYLKAMK